MVKVFVYGTLRRGEANSQLLDGATCIAEQCHNFPYYGISLGVSHKGEGLIGVVYNSLTDELFYGAKGYGAY